MSLRERYQEYYRPTPDQFKQLWDAAIFVPDTNVLLDLYRLKQPAAQDLLQIFRLLGSRLWVPEQSAKEFSQRREKAIKDKQNEFNALASMLNTFVGDFTQGLKHCYFEKDTSEVASLITKFAEELHTKLEDRRTTYPRLLDSDTLFEALNELVGDKIGSPFDAEELKAIYDEGGKRYADKIPPGFKDNSKPEPDRYGDLIIWKQVITKAKQEQKPVIFITRDTKEDWYSSEMGRTTGPRPELIKEMREQAGVLYYQYTTEQFLEYGAKHFEQKLQPDTLSEIREVAEVERAAEKAVSTRIKFGMASESLISPGFFKAMGVEPLNPYSIQATKDISLVYLTSKYRHLPIEYLENIANQVENPIPLMAVNAAEQMIRMDTPATLLVQDNMTASTFPDGHIFAQQKALRRIGSYSRRLGTFESMPTDSHFTCDVKVQDRDRFLNIINRIIMIEGVSDVREVKQMPSASPRTRPLQICVYHHPNADIDYLFTALKDIFGISNIRYEESASSVSSPLAG